MSYITDLGYFLTSYIIALFAVLASLTFVPIAALSTNIWGCFNRTFTGSGSMSANEMGGCSSGSPNVSNNSTETQEFVNELIDRNKVLEDKNRRQKEINEALKSELKKTKHEYSEMIGRNIDMCAKDNFNNTSDPLQPIDISKRCEDMFDTEWRNVMNHRFKSDEEKGIQFLSKIFKDCQTFCKQTAQTQISVFTNPCSPKDGCDVRDVLASEEDVHLLYKIRRKVGQFKATKESVIECFYKQCIQDIKAEIDNTGTSSYRCEPDGTNVDEAIINDSMEYLDAYIKNCTDMCWQAAILDPPVYFEFRVLGKRYDEIKSKFSQYSGKTSGGMGQAKTVKSVVWPAVVKLCSGGEEVLIANKKGCVILCDDTSL